MTCKHPVIQTWKYEDGEPAMWSCVDCRQKFVPFSQMLQEVADEREACAKECEHTALRMGSEWMAHHCAAAIRIRGQDSMPLFDDWGKKW